MTDEPEDHGARATAAGHVAAIDEALLSRVGAQPAGDQPVPRGAEVLPLRRRREPARRASGHDEVRQDDERDGLVSYADAADAAEAGEREFAHTDADADADADVDAGGATALEADTALSAQSPRDGAPGGAEAADDDATLCAWIARIARQDERALEALYDATASRVQGVVLRITQRHALAEEVLEDTFWQVWRQAPRFDLARGRPITWLLAMARSRAIDALRREQRFRHHELPDDDVVDAADRSAGHHAPPQDLLEATRGHAHVHAALASLEPRARQLVALAFFRGLTHEEIAAQQQMPLGTVKSLIRRALQQLKRVMEAEHA